MGLTTCMSRIRAATCGESAASFPIIVLGLMVQHPATPVTFPTTDGWPRKIRLIDTRYARPRKGNELIRSEFRRHVAKACAAVTSRVAMSLCLTGLLFAVVAGPFGTFQTMGTVLRLVYWGCVIASGVGIGVVIDATLMTFCRDWHPLWIDLTASILITTVLAPLICVLRASLDPVLTQADLALGAVWLHTAAFVAPVFFLRRQLGRAASPSDPPRPRLLRRLPEPLQQARVLRLSGRDHTVEIATDQGNHTLRLRLGDAIEEMEPVEGVCTHRSHWVARAAITGHACEGGKLYLTLSNGDRVPVSRRYRPRLEALGLVPLSKTS